MKMIHVDYAVTQGTVWGEREEDLLHRVSSKRQQKIRNFLREEDRILSLYAALLCRKMLAEYGGPAYEELHFSVGKFGKPYLNPDIGPYFSISHTEGCVLCTVSSSGETGADVEKIRNAPFDIMDSVFHRDETMYITEGCETEKERRFFQIWTRKEAVLKQAGTGFSDNAPDFNTLAEEYAGRLHTWCCEDWMISVCGCRECTAEIRQRSKEELWEV